jgi:membrane protease YdiL (CAAX protease family)
MTSFIIAVLCAWAALCLAGVFYTQQHEISTEILVAVMPALLLESALYLATGFERARRLWERIGSTWTTAAALTLSAPLPYALYSIPLGLFRWTSLIAILALAAIASFWYLVLPRRAVADICFLGVMAAGVLSGVFGRLYESPTAKLPAQALGEVMWIRLGVMSALLIRRMEGVGAGFLPTGREWAVGARHFLYFLPAGIALGRWLDLARLRDVPSDWSKLALTLAATFAGMLWFVAYSEEFFFRGLLQQWLSRWLKNGLVGLLLASAAFGLVHLPFRDFPNWRLALVAAVAGCFYGRAFQQTGSIRAAMVTHALVATTWRVFLV